MVCFPFSLLTFFLPSICCFLHRLSTVLERVHLSFHATQLAQRGPRQSAAGRSAPSPGWARICRCSTEISPRAADQLPALSRAHGGHAAANRGPQSFGSHSTQGREPPVAPRHRGALAVSSASRVANLSPCGSRWRTWRQETVRRLPARGLCPAERESLGASNPAKVTWNRR